MIDITSPDFIGDIATLATKALIYEVSVTPKPGLVDRFDSGSHSDMDYFTFLDSALVLRPHFREIARLGMEFNGSPEEMLPTLRIPGQEAERAMLAVTGGVNTHKGLIFSMGIICAAAGHSARLGGAITLVGLLELCGLIARASLEDFHLLETKTHGSDAYRAFGVTGIRGEAAEGFPSVRDYGYPVLRGMVEQGYSLNDAGVVSLLHLMANVRDTNVIARGGRDSLDKLQSELYELLASEKNPGALVEYAVRLNKKLIAAGISPGGSADLLAISFMLYFLLD